MATVVSVVESEAEIGEGEEEDDEVEEVEAVPAETAEDCSLVKREHNGIGTGFDRNRGATLVAANVGQPPETTTTTTTNKRCSPVSVITSPPCQPRTTSPPLYCTATHTTITAAASVLIKSESVD